MTQDKATEEALEYLEGFYQSIKTESPEKAEEFACYLIDLGARLQEKAQKYYD